MAEVGGFEVEASGFEGGEQGLNAPAQAVIGQGHLGMMIGGQNQEFGIDQRCRLVSGLPGCLTHLQSRLGAAKRNPTLTENFGLVGFLVA